MVFPRIFRSLFSAEADSSEANAEPHVEDVTASPIEEIWEPEIKEALQILHGVGFFIDLKRHQREASVYHASLLIDDSASTDEIHTQMLQAIGAFHDALCLSSVSDIALARTYFLHGRWPWGSRYVKDSSFPRVGDDTLKHDGKNTPLLRTIGQAMERCDSIRQIVRQELRLTLYQPIVLVSDGLENVGDWPLPSPGGASWKDRVERQIPAARKQISEWQSRDPKNILVGVALGDDDAQVSLTRFYERIGIRGNMIVPCDAGTSRFVEVMQLIAERTSMATTYAGIKDLASRGILG